MKLQINPEELSAMTKAHSSLSGLSGMYSLGKVGASLKHPISGTRTPYTCFFALSLLLQTFRYVFRIHNCAIVVTFAVYATKPCLVRRSFY